MNGIVVGAVGGIVFAVIALIFGFWGLLLAAALAVVGGLTGAVLTGRVDGRALRDVLRGRRSAA